MDDIIYYAVLVLVIIVLVVIVEGVLVAAFSILAPQVTSIPLTESEPIGLGRQLVFPEGWTPVLFSATSFDKGGFVFICERERIYRYCTPVVIEAGNDR